MNRRFNLTRRLTNHGIWFVGVLAVLLGQGDETNAQQPSVPAADHRVQDRSYAFPGTGKATPYALFVPSNYDRGRSWPLIVGLHGAGGSHTSLMLYDGILDFAQRDGYLMVTPLGYHPRGGYGLLGPGLPRMPESAVQTTEDLPPNLGDLSERDVMNVLEIVRREFNIDDDRIYLFGHSMGGGGAYHLAAKYPQLWAGLAVSAPGTGFPAQPLDTSVSADLLLKFRQLPLLVLQGDQDKTVPVSVTRKWIRKMSELGMQHIYVEIEGGDHGFISRNPEILAKVFSFFNIVRKKAGPPV